MMVPWPLCDKVTILFFGTPRFRRYRGKHDPSLPTQLSLCGAVYLNDFPLRSHPFERSTPLRGPFFPLFLCTICFPGKVSVFSTSLLGKKKLKACSLTPFVLFFSSLFFPTSSLSPLSHRGRADRIGLKATFLFPASQPVLTLDFLGTTFLAPSPYEA